MSLVLFDIDGTLLLSGGAGVRAMTQAFETLFGIPDGFAGIPVPGHTDTYLLSGALRRASLPDTPDVHARFQSAYVHLLAEEIRGDGVGRRGVLPGVENLLVRMRDDSAFHLALLTGNYARSSAIKLEHFGLAEFFGWGIFGEESVDRNELGRVAIRRARERRIPDHAITRAVVIGDTPNDIACARAAGARAVGVATGSHSLDELTAAGADLTLPDLSDTDHVLSLLR